MRRLFWDGDGYPVRAKFTMAMAWVCGPAGAFGVVSDRDLSGLVKFVGLGAALVWTLVASVVLAELMD